jgi:hypothetical protein
MSSTLVFTSGPEYYRLRLLFYLLLDCGHGLTHQVVTLPMARLEPAHPDSLPLHRHCGVITTRTTSPFVVAAAVEAARHGGTVVEAAKARVAMTKV